MSHMWLFRSRRNAVWEVRENRKIPCPAILKNQVQKPQVVPPLQVGV